VVIHARRFPVALLALLIAGCSERIETQHHQERVNHDSAVDTSLADTAWSQLLFPEIADQSRPNETDFQRFLREYELAAQARRRLATDFWQAYPDDDRRYQALLLALHATPSYPENIDTWVDEFPSPTRYLKPRRNWKSVATWDAEYARMRAEFFKAARPVHEVRFLELSELRDAIARMPHWRKSEVPDRLDGVLSLTETLFQKYREPIDAVDESDYYGSVRVLMEFLFEDNSRILNHHMDRVVPALEEWSSRDDFVLSGYASVYLRQIREEGSLLGHTERPGSRNREWLLLPQDRSIRGAHVAAELAAAVDDFKVRRVYREWGFALFDADGDIEEAIRWFAETSLRPPVYLDQVSLDISSAPDGYSVGSRDAETAVVEAERLARMRDILLADDRMDAAGKARVEKAYVRSNITLQMSGQMHSPLSTDASVLLNEVLAVAQRYGDHSFTLAWTAFIFDNRALLGISTEQVRSHLATLRESEMPGFREFARDYARVMTEFEKPFEFAGYTIEGEHFDVSRLRGKVVLVDHWTTTCASCIAAMPGIHETYLDYRDRGFEVVSIVYDWAENGAMVRRLKSELGLEWPTLVGDDEWQRVATQYGYSAWPQYMVLDSTGRIVAGTAEVDNGRNLEGILKRLLVE